VVSFGEAYPIGLAEVEVLRWLTWYWGSSYIIYALVKVKFGFYLSAVLFGFTAWSIPTIMAAAAGDYVGPRLAPAGLGFITLFFGIGQALGPVLGGYIADATRSFTIPFLVAGGISLAGMVFSLFLKKPVPS
jgi:MFS family permease